MKWPVKKLGDICEIISGATPSTTVKEYWGDDFFWATPKDLSDLNDTEIKTTIRKISALGLKSCAATLLPINSVLFSSRAPIGLVAINAVPIATNQGFKNLVPNRNLLDTRYLYHWLTCNRKKIDAMGVGATFKEVSKAIVSKIEIPLPPLAEQQRIAALLDTADRILKQRESAIAKLDQLAQSIFVDIFKNEKDIKKVSDLFSINMNKLNINLKDEDDVAFIPMAAVSEKSKVIVDHQTRKFLDVKKGYTPIANGDLIVAKITPCYENGKMAIANLNFGNFAYGSTEFHTFRSNNPKLISYLHYFLMNEQLRISGAKSMKGAAGQRRVPSEFFAELKIASPSIKSLNSFCDIIFEIDSIKSKSAIAIEQCKKLILSLQHQSFAVN